MRLSLSFIFDLSGDDDALQDLAALHEVPAGRGRAAAAGGEAGDADGGHEDADGGREEYSFEHEAEQQAQELLAPGPEPLAPEPPPLAVPPPSAASSSSSSSSSTPRPVARCIPGKRYKQVYLVPAQGGEPERHLGELQPVGFARYQLVAVCAKHSTASVKCRRVRAWKIDAEPLSNVEDALVLWLHQGLALTQKDHDALPKV